MRAYKPTRKNDLFAPPSRRERFGRGLFIYSLSLALAVIWSYVLHLLARVF